MDDIEFIYNGEEDALDDDNLNEDLEVWTVCDREKDLNWTK